MAELKTQKNNASVADFLSTIEPAQKRADCEKLVQIFEEVTGEKATMWGTAMIGFGSYHYKSERSKQEGDWPLIAFSPRKANITAYIMSGAKNHPELLEKLGKFKKSEGSCLYFNHLADLDEMTLRKLILASFEEMKRRYS